MMRELKDLIKKIEKQSVKIVWPEPARQDLREIFSYIAEENPKAPRALLTDTKERIGIDRPDVVGPCR